MSQRIVADLLLGVFDTDPLVEAVLQSLLERHRAAEIVALELLAAGFL